MRLMLEQHCYHTARSLFSTGAAMHLLLTVEALAAVRSHEHCFDRVLLTKGPASIALFQCRAATHQQCSSLEFVAV